ncbi:AAA family ATPase [Verrucomicrobiaceae bacterium 5K15]|uniref:AAA family ATPase n=1 Tax=Oceaniferula flava TaxID=2800421 RepID=A0AAE2V8E3_9BACT|nr:AAA family ATPase [Oceaniferula flavus]MBK1853468.1 AAA family ATPase [Oceaniferula flavus]MBM1134773.1 AAA family ATPase [Oceaniferula flavus]
MSESKPPSEQWESIQNSVAEIRTQTAKVIVGQEKVVEEMLVSLLCKGHCLLTGVPGLAKTLLVSTLGTILGLKFQRIQFTPDLMPTDIVGSEILQTGDGAGRGFEFVPGPIFANLILADEVNRTPPKTQAALLEAMQEKQVTVAGQTRNLDEPFIVFATQNPIEHEGTYPLPEAQLDRFFFNVMIDYPTIEEEEEVIRRTTGRSTDSADPILDAAGVIALQDATLDVPLPDNVVKYILQTVHKSRPNTAAASDFVNNYVDYGAGPRASQCLARAARALALLRGRSTASVEEVRDVALPILRHRVIPNYNATGEGVSVENVISELLKD